MGDSGIFLHVSGMNKLIAIKFLIADDFFLNEENN